MCGRSDNNRSEGQGGCREALSTKEVWSKGTTVGTRTGSEAERRAMSVRESAKSNSHRKTHLVEPDGTGREFMHLTRGDLHRESGGEVSRGRSSEEGRETRSERRAEETGKRDQPRNSALSGGQSSETDGVWQLRPPPRWAPGGSRGGFPGKLQVRVASHGTGEPRKATRCAKR